MPSIIDPETMPVDDLPGVWSPVLPPDLTERERLELLDSQSAANLLYNVNIPEAILRLLLNETEIEPAYDPPKGYDPEQQGEWDPEIFTLAFKKPVQLDHLQRTPQQIVAVYDFGPLGHWRFEIEAERVLIERV
jgi:hypothetical protein